VVAGLALAGYLAAYRLGVSRELVVPELPFDKPESVVLRERLAEHAVEGPDGRLSWNTDDPELLAAFEALARWQIVFTIADERFEDMPAYDQLCELLRAKASDWPDEDWSNAESLIEENADLIETLQEAAQIGGPGQIVPTGELLTSFFSMRCLLQLVSLRVRLHARAKDQVAAVDDVLLMMRAADVLSGEPNLRLYMSAIYGYDIARVEMEDAFPPGTLDAGELDRILDHTAHAYHREALAESLYADAVWYADILATGARREGRVGGCNQQRAFLKNRAEYVEYLASLLDIAGRPYYEVAPILADVTASAMNEDPLSLTKTAVETCRTHFATQARHEASVDLLRLGLLIEQHYAEHGSYPDSLNVLAPALDGTVPLDPFSGESYRYVIDSAAFLLYSVGQNQVDDGGVHDWADGDWVWRGG
jgi:hypothetical protein